MYTPVTSLSLFLCVCVYVYIPHFRTPESHTEYTIPLRSHSHSHSVKCPFLSYSCTVEYYSAQATERAALSLHGPSCRSSARASLTLDGWILILCTDPSSSFLYPIIARGLRRVVLHWPAFLSKWQSLDSPVSFHGSPIRRSPSSPSDKWSRASRGDQPSLWAPSSRNRFLATLSSCTEGLGCEHCGDFTLASSQRRGCLV